MGSGIGDTPFEGREYSLQENRWKTRRFQETRLKTRADFEDVNFRAKRGVDKRVYLGLAGCFWISRHHNLIITGPTGVGESYLVCPRVKGMPRGLTICYCFRTLSGN